MGTKVENLPGYYSMRDLNEESSSCGWSDIYGDKSLTNGQYYDNYLPISITDACSERDKDAVKRTMLEHEAIFKNQVYELHRLYRMQRGMMNEFQTKELHKNQIPVEASFSPGPMESQVTTEDRQKWHISGFPMGNSTCAQTSMSGVEGIHSPLGLKKGTSKQTSPFPSSNGCSSSKDVEVLVSRPSKARRRMFDLQLPPDEYIDPEESEKFSDEKTSDPSFFLCDRNCKNEKDGDAKHFCKNGLADLNEPAPAEETYNSPYVHLLSHNPSQGATECSDLSAVAKQKSHSFGLSREQLLNSHHVNNNWACNNGYLENNGSGKGWYPSVTESGQDKSNIQLVPQVLNLEKSPLSSQTIQDAHSKVREPASDHLNGRNKADMRSERTVSDLHNSERNHEYFVNKHPESGVPLHRPGFAAAPSSDLSKVWSPSASSWQMATSSLGQRMMRVQTPPCLNASGALSRSSQPHQSNGILEECWPRNINSMPNRFQCILPLQNGFYPGSSSWSKEPSANIPLVSYDYLNHCNDCKIIPGHFINNGSSKSSKGSNSNCNGMNSRKDIDLNVLFSNGSSKNLVPQSGVGIMDGELKNEEGHAMLPWPRGKTTCKNDVQNTAGESSLFHAASFPNKDDTGKWPGGKFMHNVTSVLCSNDIEARRTKVNESSSNKRILGVPIFDMLHISPKKELSSLTSPFVSNSNPSNVEAVVNKKKLILDINLPCDVAVVELDKEAFTQTVTSKARSPTAEAVSRNQIDLNLSLSEDEESFTTIPRGNTKALTEIDLEAPVVPETEEDVILEEREPETSLASSQVPQDKVEHPKDDELMTNAADAIVVLSTLSCKQVDSVINSPSESPNVDPLSWFADVASTCKDNLEGNCDIDGKDNKKSASRGMDYFELMTLKLPEMKEEDYMPEPLVPENFKVEETTATSIQTRTRKGSARRGMQQRDFQKDILPSLSSLSRQEVTEDLQTFGGLMKEAGHSWHAGPTRRSSSRNGGGKGRRGAQVTPSPPTPMATNETSTPMKQLNNIEVALKGRSLTSWGKTTRRPRRQRCPVGIPPLIPLT